MATAAPREPGPGEERHHAAAELPEPLLDLLALLPPLVDAERAGPLPASAAALLLAASPPLADVQPLLPRLAAVISAGLRSSALGLARVAHPSTPPSSLHCHVASLPDYSALLARVAAAHLRTAASLACLVDCYSRCLGCLVRSLEAKHGVVARGVELRASDLSVQARRSELDAADAMRSLTRLYSPRAVAALRNYAHHLDSAQARAPERVRSLQADLADYGVGTPAAEAKEKTMRDMARLYRDMNSQVDDIKSHLSRLNDS